MKRRDSLTGLNTTAYRIFKVLSWLMAEPLTLEELNQRFVDDPEVGKSVSHDSIWLYLNTLRALGCQISRPSQSNQFRYILSEQPFTVPLSRQDIDLISQMKQWAEPVLNWRDHLALDNFMTKALQHRYPHGEVLERLSEYFQSSRTENLLPHQEPLEQLSLACQNQSLLWLQYQSPRQGTHDYWFLPVRLMYRSGVIYLLGLAHGREYNNLLRVDRIVNHQRARADQEPLREALLDRLKAWPEVEVLIYFANRQDWQPLGSEVFVEEVRPEGSPPYLRLRIQDLDWFGLRQRLLSLPFPVKILSPKSFARQYLDELKALELSLSTDLANRSDVPVESARNHNKAWKTPESEPEKRKRRPSVRNVPDAWKELQ
jgi:predicted DNA-binding transcriptional regulator YafY